jgi:hypothetical protein
MQVRERSASLDELHATVRVKVGSAIAAVQLLTVAAPFCDPLLSEVRADLQAALEATLAAQRLEEGGMRRLAGPRFHRRRSAL